MSAALSAASIKASADQIAANTDALGGHTVKSDVPADAKFTDTVYDDSDIKRRIADASSDIVDINNELIRGWQMVQAKQDATPSSALTDPAGTGIQLVANQKIDYDKLADAIIAKYQGQTLAGKAQSVKSALDTVRSVQDQTIKTEDSSTPCSYSAGNFFVYDGKLYKASADFSSVTLTADNISTYAEAQTQTAINALHQSLLNRYNDTSLLIDESKIKRWVPDGSEQSYGTVNHAWYWKIGYTVYVDIDIKFNSDSAYAIFGLPNGYKPIANSDVTICINGGDLDTKNRSYLRLKPAFVQPLAKKGGRVQIYYNYQAFG